MLVVLGAMLLGASVAQRCRNGAYGIGLLVFGSGLVTVGVVLPRLRNAEVGPATGFKLTLAEQREVSTELAVSELAVPELAASELAASERAATVDAGHVVAATRLILASETLARLLAPDCGPLADALFHLYLFDEQRQLLLPAFEGRPSPSRGWKPGTGAVGDA